MSGTEITYEDKKKIDIKVLLDKSKVEITQVLYRIVLIIESSILSIIEKLDLNELRINENEIDRLYHLMAKMISISLIDSKILNSSKINNISLIPSYFLISKRLENIGDSLYYLSKYLYKNKVKFMKKNFLSLILKELDRSARYLIAKNKGVFVKEEAKFKEALKDISLCEDKEVASYLKDILRYLIDIQEEIVNLSFYHKLISKEIL